MSPLAKSIADTLNSVARIKHVIIAFSGGVDSHVLLHACNTLKPQFKSIDFQAIHINHGLQQTAQQWVVHCQTVSESLAIDFLAIEVDAVNKGDGPEQTARKARYTALGRHTQENTLVLTAQHQEDQAETLMLQLLRGCGVQGLASMPALDVFGLGLIGRPFLQQPKQSIIDYAKTNNLSWINDPSNQDTSLDRNYLRCEVIPLLKKRWPAFSQTTARTAKLCAESSDLLTDVAAAYVSEVNKHTLDLDKVLTLSDALQRVVLRHWLSLNDLQSPSFKIIQEIQQAVIAADIDKVPVVKWAAVEIRRYKNKLYVLPPLSLPPMTFKASFIGDTCALPSPLGSISLIKAQGQGIKADIWRSAKLEVRFRQGGERIKLAGREGTKRVKRLLHEQKLLPWVRDSLPLIFIDDELAAVADLWVGEAFAAAEGEESYQICWQHPNLSIL